jgi:hypothetical protein
MSVSEAFRDVVDESVASTESAPGANGFHLEPRCRICRNDQVRTKVNDLLATGASYAMVLRALGDDNAKLEQGDRVTIDSIRDHTARHFPVQQAARATYREILECRAKENSVDFIEGVATAITPLAFLETIMVKGYQTGAGLPRKCSRKATTPSMRASNRSSIPAATNTSRQLVLDDTTARGSPASRTART